MNTKLIAFSSVLMAATALASAAQAGGGVRLGFGGPLGTFVATPAHGGGSHQSPKMAKKAPVHQAARKPEKIAPRIAKAEAPEPAKPAAEKTDADTGGAAPVTGSSALIQGSIPEDGRATGTPETAAPGVEAEASSEPAVTVATGKAPDESAPCKKFIPAVSLTVSVSCE
jgi:hypothetical protein